MTKTRLRSCCHHQAHLNYHTFSNEHGPEVHVIKMIWACSFSEHRDCLKHQMSVSEPLCVYSYHSQRRGMNIHPSLNYTCLVLFRARLSAFLFFFFWSTLFTTQIHVHWHYWFLIYHLCCLSSPMVVSFFTFFRLFKTLKYYWLTEKCPWTWAFCSSRTSSPTPFLSFLPQQINPASPFCIYYRLLQDSFLNYYRKLLVQEMFSCHCLVLLVWT